MTKEELKTDESKYITELVIKDKLKSEFEKYLKDSADYYDPREPLTERKLLQMWLDCAEPREKRIAELEAQLESERDLPAIAYIQGAEKQKKKDEEQLTKAKEIIKNFLEFVNNEIEYDPEHPQEHTDLWNKLCEEAEEFLKEIGK